MKALILILAFAIAFGDVALITAHAVFHPNKPSCTTTCKIVNGVETCHTVCSGGNN